MPRIGNTVTAAVASSSAMLHVAAALGAAVTATSGPQSG